MSLCVISFECCAIYASSLYAIYHEFAEKINEQTHTKKQNMLAIGVLAFVKVII